MILRVLLSLAAVVVLNTGAVARDLQRDLAAVAAKARPAVVSLQVNRSRRLAPEIHELLLDFEIYPESSALPVQGATGSGVIVSRGGQVLTNFHVVQGAQRVTVVRANGERLGAKVVGMDPRTDLAVLQIIEPGVYPTLPLGDSSKLRVGHVVMAIGNPFDFALSTTMGIVSAMGRRGLSEGEIQDFIQTDAAVNPGNSGGPLVNLKGEIIGINTAIFSVGREQNSGISFAIPSNMVKRIREDLKVLGRVRRARLGIVTQSVSDEADDSGVEVTWVLPFGPGQSGKRGTTGEGLVRRRPPLRCRIRRRCRQPSTSSLPRQSPRWKSADVRCREYRKLQQNCVHTLGRGHRASEALVDPRRY